MSRKLLIISMVLLTSSVFAQIQSQQKFTAINLLAKNITVYAANPTSDTPISCTSQRPTGAAVITTVNADSSKKVNFNLESPYSIWYSVQNSGQTSWCRCSPKTFDPMVGAYIEAHEGGCMSQT